MAEVFADTSGWASFFVRTDDYHAAAVTLVHRLQAEGTRLVTTNYVLAELVALYASRVRTPRSQWIKTIESIKSASWVEIVHVDRELDEAAWALLKSRLDKDWSLVDCVSFVVMQRRGLTEALTTDHHFEQAGFLRLLK
jgi:predicted nucleic acid-binding protein